MWALASDMGPRPALPFSICMACFLPLSRGTCALGGLQVNGGFSAVTLMDLSVPGTVLTRAVW